MKRKIKRRKWRKNKIIIKIVIKFKGRKEKEKGGKERYLKTKPREKKEKQEKKKKGRIEKQMKKN